LSFPGPEPGCASRKKDRSGCNDLNYPPQHLWCTGVPTPSPAPFPPLTGPPFEVSRRRTGVRELKTRWGWVQMGGIGFVHYNMSQEEQVGEVEKVKAHSTDPNPDQLRAGEPSLDKDGRWGPFLPTSLPYQSRNSCMMTYHRRHCDGRSLWSTADSWEHPRPSGFQKVQS
jgi:hypothetical protein